MDYFRDALSSITNHQDDYGIIFIDDILCFFKHILVFLVSEFRNIYFNTKQYFLYLHKKILYIFLNIYVNTLTKPFLGLWL